MYTCQLWWNYTAQSFHQLKVAFNNAFRMMRNLPTYCSANELFTVNRVADLKPSSERNLVHRFKTFMMRLTISKYLRVRSIVSSDLVCSVYIAHPCSLLLYIELYSSVSQCFLLSRALRWSLFTCLSKAIACPLSWWMINVLCCTAQL